MTSLAEWMRKSLLWGSSCPSAEELSEEYIKPFEAHMRESDCAEALNYQYAVERALRFLRGEKEPLEL